MTSRRADEARFAELMDAVANDLLSYFERRTGSDAADLLTETMLIAWNKRASVPDDLEQARMWLFGVARNVLRNSSRGTVRRLRLADALRSLTEDTAHQPDPAEAVAIRDLVDRLPSELAEVVLLVHWEGFSHAEIGQLLGVPASTVRGRYQRAKAALKIELTVPR